MSYLVEQRLRTSEMPKSDLPRSYGGKCNLRLDVGRKGGFDATFYGMWVKVKNYAKNLGKEARTNMRKDGWMCSLYEENPEYCPTCPAYRTQRTQTLTQPTANRAPRDVTEGDVKKSISRLDDMFGHAKKFTF